MQPEPTPDQIASKPAVEGNEWDGPWGSIAPVPHSIETLCVQIEQVAGKPRIYYYPYHTIGKWNWSMGVPEILEIQIGGVQVTLSGAGLRRLAEALNMGNLRLMQLNVPPAWNGQIRIESILLEDNKG